MGFTELGNSLIYCNPYLNPFGWTSHLNKEYSINYTDLNRLTKIDAELAKIKSMGINTQVKSITVHSLIKHL